MSRFHALSSIACVGVLCFFCTTNIDAPSAWAANNVRILLSWDFNKPGDLEGWQPNGHLADVSVANGILRCRAVNWDPFLVSRVFDIPARAWQYIEVRMKADKDGIAEFFWSNTLKTKYGGFSPGKETRFHVKGDGQWHIYRIFPFWQTEKKIIHLRFDLFDGAQFDVDYVRICEPAPRAQMQRYEWDFEGGTQSWWTPDGPTPLQSINGRLVVQMPQDPIRLLAPPLNVALDRRGWVGIRMKVDKGRRAAIVFATDRSRGLASHGFPIIADGKFHTYNVDLAPARAWDGTLLAVGLRPTDAPGARVEIDSFVITRRPIGAPDIVISYFGFENAANRAQRPVRILATIDNRGGEAARGVRATLEVPPQARIVEGKRTQIADCVRFYEPVSLRWTIVSKQAGTLTFRLHVETTSASPQHVSANLKFLPPMPIRKADYVPEPKPVRSRFEIGAFYFPGWPTASRWEPIRRSRPQRKPLLGWYDEANPECADWQIKWAVEHGISFFMVDWYWVKGSRHLEHWLHNAYLRARYRRYLKFAIMWANHNPRGSHSVDDWRRLTQYWIDHYFRLPEYYYIDGRPAVFIWAPNNVRRDLGGSKQAAELYAMSQRMARAAGLKGVYFVSMRVPHDITHGKQLKSEGFEACTSYHAFGDAMRIATNPMCFPFKLVVQTSPALWARNDERARSSGLLYIPTVDTGWSAEPWHGDRARIIYGRTPKLFGELCREARKFAERTNKRIIALGPWNEWGEGSYIEPCVEFDFEMLDAVRDAFCDQKGPFPPNLSPADVGLGPYDLPEMTRIKKTRWTFDRPGDTEGWDARMGLTSPRVENGCLVTVSQHSDPALSSPPLYIRAEGWERFVLRMRVTGARQNDQCQLFWITTSSRRPSEAASLRVPLVLDGRFHDYVFELGQNWRWRDTVARLRLDPCSTQGAKIEIDEARFER